VVDFPLSHNPGEPFVIENDLPGRQLFFGVIDFEAHAAAFGFIAMQVKWSMPNIFARWVSQPMINSK